MNKIFFIVLILAISLLLFQNPTSILDGMILGSEKAVTLTLSLLGIYAVWLSVLELVSRTGLDKKLAGVMRPLLKKLFGTQKSEVEEEIAINLSSNMLGMGNASTPSGINAMKGLDSGKGKITRPMAMLMILNTTAIQLIPTTIIGLRVVAGSTSANSILFPTLIATFCSTFVGVVLVIIIEKIKEKRKNLNE